MNIPASYKLCIIFWRDAQSIDAWEPIGEENKHIECMSVGWVTQDNPDNIVVVPHIADKSKDEFDGCGKMVIPRSSIVKIKKIKA